MGLRNNWVALFVCLQVGHDVHSPNNRHCQCHSCNHPCAHICKTRKPKGKKWTDEMAHMCHFSSKPHAQMCCGGEDLPSALQCEPGASWKHSEVISSLRTVPTEQMYIPNKSMGVLGLHQPSTSTAMLELDNIIAKKSLRKSNASPLFLRDTCNSALLERTGSDLSISSLPSSSSVAEAYVNRSVLTDESDIDSETERSLESTRKVAHKQGFRSLVACFLANSLRLTHKSDKHKTPDHGFREKRVKKKTYGKERRRSKPNKYGLSSTDNTDSYRDSPSSVNNSMPITSLSSEASRTANEVPIPRPSALYPSSKYTVARSSRSYSPCKVTDCLQQHHNDEPFSEEHTNSSSSLRRRPASDSRTDSNEKRPSTNVSSETAASPRRRRNKGPAPKPPIKSSNPSSNSPLSANVSTSCPSSLPQSPTNSSHVTSCSSNISARKQNSSGESSKCPSSGPINSNRFLCLFFLGHSAKFYFLYRNEAYLPSGSNANVCDTSAKVITKTKSKHPKPAPTIPPNPPPKRPTPPKSLVDTELDKIYQMPLPVKMNNVPPELPQKTFDTLKMFGCEFNPVTKRLENRANDDGKQKDLTNPSQSMPFAQYTCCAHHWNEYLQMIATSCQFNSTAVEKVCDKPMACHEADHGQSDCDSDGECTVTSDLINALLSPKHNSKFKSRNVFMNNKDSEHTEAQVVISELVRAMSDGSITNTSATTVLEFNPDEGNEINSEGIDSHGDAGSSHNIQGSEVATDSKSNSTKQRCLSDVFVQTSFKETLERPSRKYKHNKHSCRCRHKYRTANNCKQMHYHHQCSCCTRPLQNHVSQYMTEDVRICHNNNNWLTSSTSEHSLSSLSSSNSTLSEASTMRTSSVLSNDPVAKIPFFLCSASISPFGEPLSQHSADTDVTSFKENFSLTQSDLISGRSTISSERLFRSAENSCPVSLENKNSSAVHSGLNNIQGHSPNCCDMVSGKHWKMFSHSQTQVLTFNLFRANGQRISEKYANLDGRFAN